VLNSRKPAAAASQNEVEGAMSQRMKQQERERRDSRVERTRGGMKLEANRVLIL